MASAVGVAAILAAAVRPAAGKAYEMAAHFKTVIKHLWLDTDDAAKVFSAPVLERLASRVASSEQRHSGQIRICVEASLPLSYLWRVGCECPLQQVIRERAVMMFGKLGVWDTAFNNGVLIYVQLAEHAIEIVADRGLAAHINSAQWTALVSHISEAFHVHAYEAGLNRAVEEVSLELERCFPSTATNGLPANGTSPNELPDTPVLF